MQQRHSPAVSYPLQRSPALYYLWLGAVVAGALVLAAWSLNGAGGEGRLWWSVAFSLGLWGVCSVCGWHALKVQPRGVLRWSGKAWSYGCAGQTHYFSGSPTVVLDVQTLIVVCFIESNQGKQRLVLQREWAPAAWPDLRRALYSPVHPTGVADAQ